MVSAVVVAKRSGLLVADLATAVQSAKTLLPAVPLTTGGAENNKHSSVWLITKWEQWGMAMHVSEQAGKEDCEAVANAAASSISNVDPRLVQGVFSAKLDASKITHAAGRRTMPRCLRLIILDNDQLFIY
jgi:hypothetical protein